ncbi:N-acetyltransferase ESCO2 isoform X2 [Sipha flava]|uniref:N-acetyltransferase ESCO2 isoform X2 n=1 Tax=Sipha flava TaxID=143950 RepID=A0A8B8FYC1_9HEMI|nr:N-acetyltransferase ESCO2 isoform X2 [Sipha flava]
MLRSVSTLDMPFYTTPRKSLRLHKNEPSPFLHDRKRELFPVDNWDEDSLDIRPLQSSPEVYNPGLASPENSFKMNCTPVTELSPTMSDKFERLMSETKDGIVRSATIVIEETPNSRRVKHFNTTPIESETNKEAKTPSKKSFNFNSTKNNKTEIAVKTSSFYGGNQLSLEDLRVKRFTRLNFNPKVKAKLFKDGKSTSKKRSRSTSQEQKTVTNLFPGTLLPHKKKSTAKKLFETTEIKRIKIEIPDNRKFFKSKVMQIDSINKKENNFNFKVVNWVDKNIMSDNLKTEFKTDEQDFNTTEILEDDVIKHIGKEIKELIELLDDNEDDDSPSTAIRYPGLTSMSVKRENEDNESYTPMASKRMKIDVQNHNHVLRSQMPDLIKDAYDFDENFAENQCCSANSSPATHPKNSSNTVESNNMVIDKSVNPSNASNVPNESQSKLFSIFTNPTPSPSPSHLIPNFTKKSTERKVKRFMDTAQYQIDAGQKKFGGFLCKQCGLYYSRGEPEDEAEHDKYHLAKEIFKYNSFKNEKVVYQDLFERIIVISSSDPKVICSKAIEVMSFVDQELGFNTQTSILPSTKKVYLYIKEKQVIGCLVVELISLAYRNLETETEDMVIISEESYPVKVGVNRIWTKWDSRGNGIATRLLDSFRKNYAYGHVLTLDEIAFTVPTRAGKQFIKKYTKKNDYLVYTGW